MGISRRSSDLVPVVMQLHKAVIQAQQVGADLKKCPVSGETFDKILESCQEILSSVDCPDETDNDTREENVEMTSVPETSKTVETGEGVSTDSDKKAVKPSEEPISGSDIDCKEET